LEAVNYFLTGAPAKWLFLKRQERNAMKNCDVSINPRARGVEDLPQPAISAQLCARDSEILLNGMEAGS
jgi:hypothetical protein